MLSKLLIAGSLFLGALAAFLRFLRGEKYDAAVFVLLGMPLIVFLVTPYLFINFGAAAYAFGGESVSTHLGADNLGYIGNLLFYAKEYLQAAGILSLPFMVIGTAFAIRERWLLPLLFSFFYWICLSALGLHWSRWALPMYVGPILLVSLGLYQSYLFLMERIHRLGAIAVLGVVCAIPLVSMLLSSATATYQLVLEDTRAVAKRWCNEHRLTAENTVFDGYTPLKPDGAKTIDYPGSNDATYVVVSSDMYDRYLKEKERYKTQADMYTRVFRLPLLASFKPVAAGVSSSFEFGNIPLQVGFLKRLRSRGGQAYSGPTILVFRKTS